MVTEASQHGITGPVSPAEEHMQVACSHHGKLVTEVIDACEIERFFRGRETLQDATLAQVPLASGKGNRTGLDEVIELLGFSRSELEAELSTEFHSRNA